MLNNNEDDNPAINSLQSYTVFGLDPTYSSFRKLLIITIKNNIVKVNEKDIFLFYLCNRGISKVEIIGWVTSIQITSKKIIYYIDDGTGIIRCTKFINNNTIPIPIVTNYSNTTSNTATTTNYNSVSADYNNIQLQPGDIVSIKGILALSETNDDIYGFNIQISNIELLSDVNLEIYHWLQCIELYRKDYSRPN